MVLIFPFLNNFEEIFPKFEGKFLQKVIETYIRLIIPLEKFPINDILKTRKKKGEKKMYTYYFEDLETGEKMRR